MRAMFGLAGVLITLGVIVWIMGHGELQNDQAALKAREKVNDQVSQIAGIDTSTGGRAMDSADFDGLRTGPKLSGLLVTRLTPGGAYEKYFGLVRNDTIVAVEYQANRTNVRDLVSEDDVKAQIAEAFQRHGSVFVIRNDKEVKLPLPQAAPAAGAPPEKKDEVQQQLDALKGMPH